MKAIGTSLAARLRLSLLLLAALGAVILPASASAQEFNPETIKARFETIRTVFDYVETGIKADARRAELQRLRDSIEPFRGELQRHIESLDPRLGEIDTRLKAIGPEPGKDAPADSADVAAERKRLGDARSEIDGLIKQARVLLTRADQIVDRVDDLRRTRLADRLFERTTSVLDPKLWLSAAEAILAEAKLIRTQYAEWIGAISGLPRPMESAVIAVAASLAAFAGIFLLQGWLRRRALAPKPGSDNAKISRLRRTKAALRDSILNAAALPLAVYAVIEILSSFEFIVGDGHRVAVGILTAVTLFSTGRALAGALLRPSDAPRRVFNLSDETAGRFYYYLVSALGVAAVGASLNILHRNLGAPRILITLTSALMATAIAVILIRLLIKTRQITEETSEEPAPNWLRLILWIVGIVILGCAIIGYVWLASFLTSRLVHASIVIASAYVILTFINAYFDEGMNPRSKRGRNFASTLGIRSSSLELAAALFAGVARVFVVVVAIFLVVGNWGTSLTDLVASFDRASFGIEFGKLRVSLYDILASIGILVVGIVLARILQNWLSNTVFPRTSLDTSLKNSIATIAGYIGVIAAISFALARLGLNLENIALVAGALSVGIGFGLQAIVSNFVSGLILLTERPVKVGDLINVKGSDGYIRKISVRSTELETFDRATLIIPNSELITGAVTNWTHYNTVSRIKIPVNVPGNADVDRVTRILLRVATKHPNVVREPAPKVMLLTISGDSLGFELRCLTNSVMTATQTKSDLNYSILRAFQKVGIREAAAVLEPDEEAEDMIPDSEAPKTKEKPQGSAAASKR